MDFYNSELAARVESRYRVAELLQAARRSVAPDRSPAPEGTPWSTEFAAWFAKRATMGTSFMARTPMNP